MGADMLIAYVDFPKEHNLDQEKATLILFVKEMKEEMIEEAYENLMYSEFDEEDSYSAAREEFILIIEAGFKALTSRHSTWINFQDRVIYLSGGLSGGDSPTTQYEDINKLAHIMGLRSEVA